MIDRDDLGLEPKKGNFFDHFCDMASRVFPILVLVACVLVPTLSINVPQTQYGLNSGGSLKQPLLKRTDTVNPSMTRVSGSSARSNIFSWLIPSGHFSYFIQRVLMAGILSQLLLVLSVSAVITSVGAVTLWMSCSKVCSFQCSLFHAYVLLFRYMLKRTFNWLYLRSIPQDRRRQSYDREHGR